VHARVTFAQVKPDDIEDSARLFEDGIIPAARRRRASAARSSSCATTAR
jgi:hypothetical protein